MREEQFSNSLCETQLLKNTEKTLFV